MNECKFKLRSVYSDVPVLRHALWTLQSGLYSETYIDIGWDRYNVV